MGTDTMIRQIFHFSINEIDAVVRKLIETRGLQKSYTLKIIIPTQSSA
jgi:hypothetical protein